MTPIRLVFLGSDPIALPLLEWLASEGRALAEVVAVFTQPDRATGRGQKITPNAIKTWADARGIPVLQPDKLTDDARAQLAAFRPDVSLVMAYGHILRDDFIGTPRLSTLNLHTSVLPKYRGASPIQTAIANGEHETGVTLMRMVRRLDAGPVADVERVTIATLDTAREVETKLATACVPLLERALPRLREGTLEFTPQDDAAATYCRKLAKEDGVLDFAAPAAVLAARINGLFPWPACTAEIAGQPVKFGLADALPATGADRSDSTSSTEMSPEGHVVSDVRTNGESSPTGELAGAVGAVLGADGDGLLIATGEGVLRVRRLQRPGGKMLPAAEFLRGFAIAPGTRLVSQPMPALVASTPFLKARG